jgi:hypothetical protein
MTSVATSGGFAALRRLAQLSIFFAMAGLGATAAALVLLPNAVALGQWILIAAGAALSITAFVFGMMISLRKTHARRAGFAVIAASVPTAVLFGLVAFVAPDSAAMFTAWMVAILVYAALTTQRVVRWPTEELSDEPKSTLAVFISYRRQDSGETVGRIHDRLLQAFEEERIFLDVDDQAAGEDYRRVIERALQHTDVVLAIIGPHWLSATDRQGRRRLDNPNDMVRIELEGALSRNLRIVPVLVEAAQMPDAPDLPPSLQPLCYRTALPVRPDPDFQPDARRLIEAVKGTVILNP